ncbi:hypothetical protein BaRGS_00020086 [Batillaria attramentaria]|uniref:Uncharacterized protein n=1 Tax=Batillaria attramentaria TaxID=370345 RepID=A0ABD0KN20_9CAEN
MTASVCIEGDLSENSDVFSVAKDMFLRSRAPERIPAAVMSRQSRHVMNAFYVSLFHQSGPTMPPAMAASVLACKSSELRCTSVFIP